MNEILKKRIEEESIEYVRPTRDIIPLAESIASKEGFMRGAEYALSHQWISVDEALPENGKTVLAIDCDNDVFVVWFDETDKTWQELSDGQFIVPTHWMPIPKITTD